LGNILRARLGLLDLAGAQALMGAGAGQKFYADVAAGRF
jgi:hypothetical protein